MAYTDRDYFLNKIKESELIKLTADDNGDEDTEKLTNAIASADDLIDSYLKKVVDELPLAADIVPESIKQCSYYIAVYYLHDNIDYADIPEHAEKNYKNSIAYLKDVSTGAALLPDIPEADVNTGVSYDVETNRFGSNSF